MRWLLLLALAACAGHAPDPKTVAAIALSNGLDAIGQQLIDDFKRRDDQCVQQAKNVAAADACFAVLDRDYEVEKIAWRALHRAHDKWADAVEHGGLDAAALAQLMAGAFCEVRRAVKAAGAHVPTIESIPIPCEE